jgi:DNA gyrase inhibitor GyrI
MTQGKPYWKQSGACLALEAEDDPDLLGLGTWMIPGGKYAREKIENWSERLWEIPQVFSALNQAYQSRVDPDRPRIEFYKSQKSFFCCCLFVNV